jgi:hypothetical protein
MKNKTLKYTIVHKMNLKIYKPVSSYITYDFETMNNTLVEKDIRKTTIIENIRHLLSLTFTMVINT